MKHLNFLTKTRWLLVPLMLLTLGVGQMWGAVGDELANCQGTGSGYGTRRTLTDGHSIGWVLSTSQSGYLGTNNATNHGKVVPTNADLPVVKAQLSTATTSTTGYYFYYTTSAISNVGSIVFSHSATNSNASAAVYVVYSSTAAAASSATWEKVTLSSTSTSAQGANVKNASGGTYTFTFNATQTSAKYYGIIIAVSGAQRFTAGTITIKEGATSQCTNPTTALSVSSSASATVGTPMTLTTANGNGGPVTWEITSGGDKATLDGATLTPTGEGSVTVKATQDDYTTGGKTYCGGNASKTITVTKAVATITLSALGATSSVSGTHYGGDSYTLPTTTTATCTGKVFVGWSRSEIEETDIEPTSNFYAKGEAVTLTAGSNIFYAVFAKAGTPVDASLSASYSSHTGWTETDCCGSSFWVLCTGASLTSPLIDDLSTVSSITLKVRTYGGANYNTVTVKTSSNESVGSADHNNTTLTSKTINVSGLTGSGSLVFTGSATTASYGPGMNDITINYKAATYTKYATTCCTELAPINGSVSGNQQNSLVLKWKQLSDQVNSWAVTYREKNSGNAFAPVTTSSITTEVISTETYNKYTISGLAAGKTYEFKLTPTLKTGVCPLSEDLIVEGSTQAAHTINAASSNTDHGTVSLNGVVITAAPATGYGYANPAYTVTSGTANVSQNGNDFTVTPSSNCTVRINFEQQNYAVTMAKNQDDNAIVISADRSNKHYGDEITVSVTNHDGYLFDGWEASPEVTFANENAESTTFDMPASDVTVTAKFIKIYSVEEALGIIDALPNNNDQTENAVYVSGIVTSTTRSYNNTYKSLTYCISDDGTNTSELKIYSGMGLADNTHPTGADFSSVNDLQNGDEVIVYGKLLKYKNGSNPVVPEMNYPNYIYSLKRLNSISVKTAPDDIEYTANEQFDPTGLIITLTYSNSDTEDVAYAGHESDFTFSPTTSASLDATNTTVQITYKGKSVNQAITVNRITTSLGWSAASYQATQGDDYSFPTLTTISPAAIASSVTYSSTNTDVATINASGVITVKTHGTTTIKADFAQTNVYAAATTASYTLTINEDMTPRLVVDPSSLTFSATPKDDAANKTFNLVGTHLTANATLAITSATEGDAEMFSVVSSVDKNGSGVINQDITVTYTPTAAGSHSATLTISSTGAADVTVALSGTALETDIYKSALHTDVLAWADYDEGKKMAGNSYTVPNPGSVSKGSDNCAGNHYRFAGWVEDNYKEAPSGHIIAASGTKNAAGKVYWAVWEKETAVGDDTYEMTTSVAVGDVVVIAEIDQKADGKAGKELTSISTTSTKYGLAADFTTLPEGTKEWTVVTGNNSTGVAFQNSSNYLYWTSGNSLDVDATLSDNTSWTVTTDSERAKIVNNSDDSRIICWNSSSNARFAAYASKEHGAEISGGGNFYYPVFYKKVPGVVYGDPITYCCTPHDIILADTDGEVYSSTILTGVYEADPTSACAGTEVELTALAEEGYEFGEWTVTYVDGESQQQSITVENDKFLMPSFETTVAATFTKIAVTGVTINGYSSVAKGDNITLTLDITPSTARPTVEWSSSNNDIATVVDGVVTGVAQGSVTITATVDGTDYTKDITVTRETKLNSITVVNPKTTYTLNEEFVAPRVDANYLYVDDESAAPTLEDVEGATFDDFDNQHAGEQTITVTYGDKTTTYDVTVSSWTLNLQTKAQTGPSTVTPSVTEVTINTYGSEIDLTNYYVENLCSAYTQVGFIASSTDVNSEIEPENLLTAYTPTEDNQTLYAVFSHTGYTGKVLVDEDFSSITAANSNTEISASDFSWIASESKVFPEVGYVKFGSSNYFGSITSIELDLSHKFKVSMGVMKYNTDNANIKITADESTWTSSTSFNTDEFTSIEHEFSAVGEDVQLTIETNGAKRAYIDNIKIETLDEIGYTSVYDCRSDMTITYAIATADAEAGATGACEEETVKQGNDYTVCTNEPTWAGHEFAGWSDGENIVGATIENVQGNITLTATWNEIVADEISISSDDITAGVMTLDDGRTATLTVTFDPTDTYNKTITWSEDSHYTITDNGDGTYQIQAKDVTDGVTVTATTANSKSASFSLVVNAATKLTGLTLEGLTEANTVYTIGDVFSTTGVVVNTTVNMGEAPQAVEADFSTPDMTTAGVKTITVEYTHPEYGYASTTYEITVNAKYVHLYRNEALIETRTLNSTAESVTLPDGDNATWAPKVAGYSLIGFADAANAQYPKVAAGASYVPSVQEISLYALYTNVVPTYTLIESAGDLVLGRSIIIATKDAATQDSKDYAIGELNYTQNGQSNNRKGIEVTKGNEGTTLTAYAGATEFILMEGTTTGTYALYDPINGKYLCAQTTNSNYLRLEETLSANGSWTISTNSVVSNTTGNKKYLYFNYNSGESNSRLFSCYAENAQNMKAIAVYQSNVAVEYDPTMEMEVTTAQTLNTADVDESVNVIVKNGGELTIGSAMEINNLTVENGGKVIVSEEKALEANDLIIQSTSGAYEVAGASGQLIKEENASAAVNGDIYLEIQLRSDAMDAEASRKWYCISAPFDVAINGGFFWGDGTPMVLNTDFQLFEWDGDRRASGSSGWRRTSSNMKAHTAYFIGFDDELTNQNTIKLKAMNKAINNVATLNAPEHTGSADADKYGNWNGLGNPNFHHIGLNKKVHAFNYNTQTYATYEIGDCNFVVGTPFFLNEAGDIDVSAADENNQNYRAPKREGENYKFRVRIGKSGAEIADNHVYVLASETASASYEKGHDVITMNDETSKYSALIWTKNYGMRLAIEEAPLVDEKATYELGIFAPAAGAYSISVANARENADLYLTYEGSIIWNLSEGEYTADLAKGSNTGYGLLLVKKVPMTPTGVDNVQSNKVQCTKVILDEKVFILRGGQMYDVTGKAVR